MAKQYLIFQRGLQPTEWEVDCLKSFRTALGGYRVGREEKTGWLAFEFDAKKFEEVSTRENTFATLLTGWRQQGCIRRAQVKFTPDETSLRPKPPPEIEEIVQPAEKSLTTKQSDVHASLGLAGLARHRRQQQMEAFGSFSKLVIPGLVGGVIVLAILSYWKIQKALNQGNIQSKVREQQERVDQLLNSNSPLTTETSEPPSTVEKLEKTPAGDRDR